MTGALNLDTRDYPALADLIGQHMPAVPPGHGIEGLVVHDDIHMATVFIEPHTDHQVFVSVLVLPTSTVYSFRGPCFRSRAALVTLQLLINAGLLGALTWGTPYHAALREESIFAAPDGLWDMRSLNPSQEN